MAGLKGRGRLIDWLLEPSHPWIRYNTLVELLDVPRSEGEAVEALAEVMRTPPISKILDGLDPNGGFTDAEAVKKWGVHPVAAGYMPKYRGAAWKLLFLAEAGADPDDERVKKLIGVIRSNTYSKEYGTFCLRFDRDGRSNDFLMPCFMGNMIWSLCKLGLDAFEVRSAFDWLVKYQRYDDGGFQPPSEFPYRGSGERCWGRHTCYWGVTNLLRAMTVVPRSFWTSEAKEARRRGVDFVRLHRLLWSSHDPSRPITTNNTRPQRLTAPLTYYHDAIEIVSIMLSLGVEGGAVDDAIEFILSKRNEDGRWVLDNAPGPLDAPFGSKGRESKWITLRALKMLKQAGRYDPHQRKPRSVIFNVHRVGCRG